MQVPSELFDVWVVLRDEGDAAEIALLVDPPVTPSTIRNAFRFGKCSRRVFKAMKDFYKQKAELIQSVLTQ